jgi:hypothetical protein
MEKPSVARALRGRWREVLHLKSMNLRLTATTQSIERLLLLSQHTAMAELDQRTDEYHPKDAVGDAIKATLVTGGAGAFISTIQNTLTKQNVGAWGVFTRSGSTIGIFGMLQKDWEDI